MNSPDLPPPGPSGAAPKKKNSGCLIAVLVVLGVALVGVVAAGVGVYQFSQSEEGKKAFEIVGESWRVQAEARDAPGVEELKAAGCTQAMVMDLSRLVALMDEEDAEPALPEDKPFTMVSCTTRSETLSCEDVRAVYLAAAPPPQGPYLIQVSVMSFSLEDQTRCQQAFAADGTRLELEGDAVPAPEPTPGARPSLPR